MKSLSHNDLRNCSRCRTALPEVAFAPSQWVATTGAWCRDCRRAYSRERVAEDPNYFLRYQLARRRRNNDRIARLKAERGCLKCGFRHPAALDFHHRDPAHKKYLISRSWQCKWETILAEIAKCDLLCSNCHRIEHYEQRRATKEAVASLLSPREGE